MLIKRIMVYLGGFNILVLGIALLITSTLGQSAWDGVYVAFSVRAHLSIGLATFITAIIILLVCFFLTKDITVFLSLVTSVIQSFLIEFYLRFTRPLLTPATAGMRYLFFALGIGFMAFGCGLYIHARFPTNHVDCLMLSISKRYSLNLKHAKRISDTCAVFITLLIAGHVQLGTFFILFTLSACVQRMSRYFMRYETIHTMSAQHP